MKRLETFARSQSWLAYRSEIVIQFALHRAQNSNELLDARILSIGKSLTARVLIVASTSSLSSTAFRDEHKGKSGVDNRGGHTGPSRITLAGLGPKKPSRRKQRYESRSSEQQPVPK